MIIVHHKIRNAKKENLHHLIEYQEHGRNGIDEDVRVAFRFTGNCLADDPRGAEAEILATATQNLRVKKQEKLAHLVISLAPGEHLSQKEWQEVAKKIADALDMGEHQYFGYVHQDTDQEHLHLIINRIHPITFKWNNMHHDFAKLGKIAEQLEDHYGLSATNHHRKRNASQRRARDSERKSGQQSFLSYVTEHKAPLLAAASWDQLHEAAQNCGFYLKKAGRGLAFVTELDGKTVMVKASAVDRKLSLAALEKRLGAWRDAKISTWRNSAEKYTARPVDYTADSDRRNVLFAAWEKEQANNRLVRKLMLSQEDIAYKTAVKNVKQEIRDQLKAAYKLLKKDHHRYEMEQQRLRLLRQTELDRLKREHDKKIMQIKRRTRTMSFNAWLAQLGDGDPLADPARDQLLSREGAGMQTAMNTVTGFEYTQITSITLLYYEQVKRTSKGQDIFASAYSRGDLIRDDGYRLLVNDKPSLITVADTLALAKKRYGDDKPLYVTGSAAFQKACAVMAVQMGIRIRCENEQMQDYYLKSREDMYERAAEQRTAGDLRGLGRIPDGLRGAIIAGISRRTVTGTVIRRGSRDSRIYRGTGRTRGRAGNAAGAERAAGRAFGRAVPGDHQDHAGSEQRPAGAERHMQDLQGSGVVREQRKDRVLVHGDERSGLGQPRSDAFHDRMRREIQSGRGSRGEGSAESPSGAGLIKNPLKAYAFERNEKRKQGFKDVKEHRVWNGETGDFTFEGFRNLGNDPVILLEKDGIIYIKICSSYEKARLHKLGRGAPVLVRSDGKAVYRPRTEQGAAQGRKARGRT